MKKERKKLCENFFLIFFLNFENLFKKNHLFYTKTLKVYCKLKINLRKTLF